MGQLRLEFKGIRERGKPFLKWAGGKTQLLPTLEELIPKKFNNYIEPFIGGGALYFYLNPSKSIISDLNEELIITYKIVQNNLKELIKELRKLKNTEEDYYQIRGISVNTLSETKRAARFIYLNKACFNGLYRVNKKGEFNVPYGKRKGTIVNEERLNKASNILKGTKILHSKYQTVISKYCKKGDFVFLDPPYYPTGKFSDFKRYTKESFYPDDQIKLCEEFKKLINKGCYVLLTNSNHPFIMELYADFEIRKIETKRLINKDASNRKGVDIIVIGK